MNTKPSRRDVIAGVAATAATLVASKAFGNDQVIHEIDIKSFKFEPQHIRVRVGDRIKWTNRDLAPHTATAEEFGWDTEELNTGESAEITVTKDMETRYFCVFHPHMKGSIEVS